MIMRQAQHFKYAKITNQRYLNTLNLVLFINIHKSDRGDAQFGGGGASTSGGGLAKVFE